MGAADDVAHIVLVFLCFHAEDIILLFLVATLGYSLSRSVR
jgi:hypothetical protein